MLFLFLLFSFSNAFDFYEEDNKDHPTNLTTLCVNNIFDQYAGFDSISSNGSEIQKPHNSFNSSINFNISNLHHDNEKIDAFHFTILLARIGLKLGYYSILKNPKTKFFFANSNNIDNSKHNKRHAEVSEAAILKECLSPEEILRQFNIFDKGISKHDFLAHICPVLIYELDKDKCRRFPAIVPPHPLAKIIDKNGILQKKLAPYHSLLKINISLAWIYALVSVLIISIIGFLLVLIFRHFLLSTTPSATTERPSNKLNFIRNKSKKKRICNNEHPTHQEATTQPYSSTYSHGYNDDPEAITSSPESDCAELVSGELKRTRKLSDKPQNTSQLNRVYQQYSPISVSDELLGLNNPYNQDTVVKIEPGKRGFKKLKSIKKHDNKALSQFCVALAVGSLSGDALLHLLPHAIFEANLTDHDHNDKIMVWKGFLTLSVIILFFVFEKLARLFSSWKQIKKMEYNRIKSPVEDVIIKDSIHENITSDLVKLKNSDPQTPQHNEANTEIACKIPAYENSHPINEYPVKKKQGFISLTFGQISSNAFTCIVGDAIHNMFDGLAIGAAYTGSVTAGLSTTIAILCHELPHELGDFAYLTKIGVSSRLCLFFNCVSSVFALLGCLIGLFISSFNHTSSKNRADDWIFCAISGMFLYVSLSNMIPDLRMVNDEPNLDGSRSCKTSVFNFPLPEQWDLTDEEARCEANNEGGEILNYNLNTRRRSSIKRTSRKLKIKDPKKMDFYKQLKYFALQIAGIFTGVTIMLIIALYEDDIQKLVS